MPDDSTLESSLGIPAESVSDEDLVRARKALDDATALVEAEVPTSLAAECETHAPLPVRLMILQAARREFENPRGLENESLGEHSAGFSETSGVYLTGREIAQIRRLATGKTEGFRR